MLGILFPQDGSWREFAGLLCACLSQDGPRPALQTERVTMFVRVGAAECAIVLLLLIIVVGMVLISVRMRQQ
jgi:hypothetical protein